MNHFNVSQNKDDIRALVGDYEENTIRPHVLGKFRDLLAATVIHPGDAAISGQFPERHRPYQRELRPRDHGAAHAGRRQRLYPEGCAGAGAHPDRHGRQSAPASRPRCQPALAHYYRGKGLFEFNPNRHDFGDKHFLGTTIKGSGIDEVDKAIAILAAEPPTAHYVSTELAQYFCCDAPPESLIRR